MSRAGILKTAAAIATGAIGVAAVGTRGESTAFAARTGARHATADANFAAYGTDTTYTPDSTIGFDASDQSSGLKTGVSAYGTETAIVATTDNSHGFAITGENSSKASGFLGGVGAISETGYGVLGYTLSGTGIAGASFGSGTGVAAESEKGIGLHATSLSA